MAEDTSLKRHFDGAAALSLGERIRKVQPGFDARGYAEEVGARVGPLELKDRVLVMAQGLRTRLPEAYPEAVDVLVRALRLRLGGDEDTFHDRYLLMPVSRFVEEYGPDHPEASFPALVEITKRHTSEFAVRPFVRRHPGPTMELMRACALDSDPHVRRFASEGIRPRLPWASYLQEFISDPAPVLEVLEPLRADPSAYVRTSVANNLNDIARDHPGLVLDVAERWSRESPAPETDRVVKHALRTLVKKGDQRALALVGATGGEHVLAQGLTVGPPVLDLGGTLELEVELINADTRVHTVVLDHVVHHVRADGSRRPKVFKWARVELGPGQSRTLRKRHTIRPITTRTYHAGEHLVEVQVNGVVKASAGFELRL